MFKYSVISCVIGFLLDILLGDPQCLYHPIRIIGKLIETVEKFVRKIFNENHLKIAGFFLVIIVCAVTVAVVFIINFIAYSINTYIGIAIDSVICYFMIAAKSLKTESMKVYDCVVQGDIVKSRQAVSMIVGRDTDNLDEKGIIKATVETVAENLSDGVIAPVIYMLIGGSILGAFYKAVNTMDSMVGYKNDKYIDLGYCAAKLDDIVNFVPSRISAIMLILSAFVLGKDYKNGFRIFIRDRFNHSSPNSAQTESACAGILRIRLAGDAYYFGKLYKKPFIGDDIEDITVENIIDINRLMYCSAILTVIIFSCIVGVGVLLL